MSLQHRHRILGHAPSTSGTAYCQIGKEGVDELHHLQLGHAQGQVVAEGMQEVGQGLLQHCFTTYADRMDAGQDILNVHPRPLLDDVPGQISEQSETNAQGPFIAVLLDFVVQVDHHFPDLLASLADTKHLNEVLIRAHPDSRVQAILAEENENAYCRTDELLVVVLQVGVCQAFADGVEVVQLLLGTEREGC